MTDFDHDLVAVFARAHLRTEGFDDAEIDDIMRNAEIVSEGAVTTIAVRTPASQESINIGVVVTK